MDDEQILAVLEGLTTDELHRLYAHICRRLPCPLRALGSDMLVHILEQMEHPGDRINFICAVTAGDDPCWTTERISAEMAARLLSDLGECQLTQTIYNVADQVHYTLPSCFRMKSFLFANWTPYSVGEADGRAGLHLLESDPPARSRGSQPVAGARSRACDALARGSAAAPHIAWHQRGARLPQHSGGAHATPRKSASAVRASDAHRGMRSARVSSLVGVHANADAPSANFESDRTPKVTTATYAQEG